MKEQLHLAERPAWLELTVNYAKNMMMATLPFALHGTLWHLG